MVSQETLDLLRQRLAVVAGQRDPTQRTVALAAVERAQKLQVALAAVTKVQATAAPGQPGAASSASAGATAAEGRAPALTSFPLRGGPGGQVAAQVSPKPFPATVLVASPTHGEVSVTGLARWFPAHTVHAKDSGAVVDGNGCTLAATDHYHVRTVSVSFEPIMEPGSDGHDALCALLQNPTAKGVSAFQAAMSRMTERA